MLGQSISHYRVVQKFGGGGMRIVYTAQDLKAENFVALKFLPERSRNILRFSVVSRSRKESE